MATRPWHSLIRHPVHCEPEIARAPPLEIAHPLPPPHRTQQLPHQHHPSQHHHHHRRRRESRERLMPTRSEMRARDSSMRVAFPTIELTPAERRQYDSAASELLQRALERHAQFEGHVDKREWQLVRQREHMSIYRSVAGASDPRAALMLGTGFIDGTVEEVMDGVYCDSTDELRINKTMLQYKFVDGGIFSLLETRTREDPFRFAGIKWFAAKAPGGSVVAHNRDLLTYERMGYINDAAGNQVAYHVLQSIDRPEWPANGMKNLRRSFTTNCYLYRRLKTNRTEVFLFGEFYGAGVMAQMLVDYAIAGKWMSVLRAPECARAKKLSRLMASVGTRPPSTNTGCDICGTRPKFLETFRNCAGCLLTVCKTCSTEHTIYKLDLRTRQPQTERFCAKCVVVACGRPDVVEWDEIGPRANVRQSSESERMWSPSACTHDHKSFETSFHVIMWGDNARGDDDVDTDDDIAADAAAALGPRERTLGSDALSSGSSVVCPLADPDRFRASLQPLHLQKAHSHPGPQGTLRRRLQGQSSVSSSSSTLSVDSVSPTRRGLGSIQL